MCIACNVTEEKRCALEGIAGKAFLVSVLRLSQPH